MSPARLDQACAAMRARNTAQVPVTKLLEPPLTAAEAATLSGMSIDWVRDHFRQVPGVILIPSRTRRGTRAYRRMSIPREVFDREMSKFIVRVA